MSCFRDGRIVSALLLDLCSSCRASCKSNVIDMCPISKSSIRALQILSSLCSLSGKFANVFAQAPKNAELAVSVAAVKPKPPFLMH